MELYGDKSASCSIFYYYWSECIQKALIILFHSTSTENA